METQTKFYTKEQTLRIIELFDNKASKKEIKEYANSIGKSVKECRQKYRYEFKKRNSNIYVPLKAQTWSEEDTIFLVNNWLPNTASGRLEIARKLQRSISSCENKYYSFTKSKRELLKNKIVNKLSLKEPSNFVVTKVKEIPLKIRMGASIKINDVAIQLPRGISEIKINDTILSWK